MIKLRPGQDRVVEFRSGLMAVAAVPGAGKTTILAYLAAELIEKQQNTQGKILIVTYMKTGVANFRRRIGDFLEAKDLPRNRGYEVRTLHSLALSILQENPADRMLSDDFEIAASGVKSSILEQVIEEWIQDNPRMFMKYFDYSKNNPGYRKALKKWREKDFPAFISSIISRFKIRGLTERDIKTLQQKTDHYSFLEWAFAVYKKYDRLLKRQGYLDFDDLINQAYNLLKNNGKLRTRLQNKYSYVFEDEAQDSNFLLEKILLFLTGSEGNLVRVGDSNQAIMGTFTEADPEVFRDFSDKDRVKKESILYSSRSSRDIMGLANKLIKWAVNEHPLAECRSAFEEKYIKPVPPDDPFPNPVTEGYRAAAEIFSDSEREIYAISRLASRHVDENPKNTVAVLVPANYVVEKITDCFEKMGVDYSLVREPSSEKLDTVKNFIELLSFLAEPYKKNLLIDLLSDFIVPSLLENDRSRKNDDFDTTFMKKIIQTNSLASVLYSSPQAIDITDNLTKKQREIWLTAQQKIKHWLKAAVSLPPDELILLISEQLKMSEEERAVAQNMALQVKNEISAHPDWKLYEIVSEMSVMEESFRKFARKIYSRQGYEPDPGVINISTYHRAKGLEWDTVYLSFLTDDNFPSALKSRFRGEHYYLEDDYSNPGALARTRLDNLLGLDSGKNPRQDAKIEYFCERLRLIYVGITRARKNLFLSAHREMIYDSGNSRKVKPARAFSVLKNYITRERKKYEKESAR